MDIINGLFIGDLLIDTDENVSGSFFITIIILVISYSDCRRTAASVLIHSFKSLFMC